MSERRERVARAIWDEIEDYHEGTITSREECETVADAAIAALDAEPTEADSEAIFYAFREHITLDMCREYLAPDDGQGPCPHPDTVEAFDRFFLAARMAGNGGTK